MSFAKAFLHFYPRPLRGGRHHITVDLPIVFFISIHALCEEGDDIQACKKSRHDNFYPRPLRGGRRKRAAIPEYYWHFYPRPLRGGRLGIDIVKNWRNKISIHALCEEGDMGVLIRMRPFNYFYPRPLRGGRLDTRDTVDRHFPISIHALCEEGDCIAFLLIRQPLYFYPRPLRGGRHNLL